MTVSEILLMFRFVVNSFPYHSVFPLYCNTKHFTTLNHQHANTKLNGKKSSSSGSLLEDAAQDLREPEQVEAVKCQVAHEVEQADEAVVGRPVLQQLQHRQPEA